MRARSLGRVELRFTGVAEGDLGHRGRWVAVDEVETEVAARRAAIQPAPWTWVRQVHDDRVVVVTRPGEHQGETADAAVTRVPGAPLAVLTADCAPVALVADADDEPVLGVAHAGWRGLLAGVIPRTVDAMRGLGARGAIRAVLGPCVHAECYAFGGDDLDAVAGELGDGVRGRTSSGAPALDIPVAVRASLAQAGVDDVEDLDVCTACAAGEYWSYRARGEMERQALVAWIS